jgi:hypothetical protein
MTAAATSSTVRVRIAIRRRGGRKVIITPDGAAIPGTAAVQTRGPPALVKALARAHRWRRLLESGHYPSLRELAAAEGTDRGYIGRTLRLTLLAPDVVEAILDGRHTEASGLLESLPAIWAEQHVAPTGRPRGTCRRRPGPRAAARCAPERLTRRAPRAGRGRRRTPPAPSEVMASAPGASRAGRSRRCAPHRPAADSVQPSIARRGGSCT